MAHVTRVVRPSSTSVNSALLVAANGLMNSSRINTRDGAAASVISIRPVPAFPALAQSNAAPVPVVAPLYLILINGSARANGFQVLKLRKSLMSATIASGATLMVCVRRDPIFIGPGADVRQERNHSDDEYCRDYRKHEYLLG